MICCKSSVNHVGAGILPSGLSRRGNNYKLRRAPQCPAILPPPLAPWKRWFAGRFLGFSAFHSIGRRL